MRINAGQTGGRGDPAQVIPPCHRYAAVAIALASIMPTTARAARYDDANEVVRLGGVWLYRYGDNLVFAQPTVDDIDWDQRRVPTQHTVRNERWQGYSWYRRHLYVTDQVVQEDLMLSLGQAREVVEVYVNGSLIGKRGRFGTPMLGGARTRPLNVIIPARLLKTGDNLIALRIYDPTLNGGLPDGPLLIGRPDAIVQATAWTNAVAWILRIILAMVSFLIAIAHLSLISGRGAGSEHRWLAGSGLALALFHICGTGMIESIIPAVQLTTRLPWIALALTSMSLTGYFVVRYEDMGARLFGRTRAIIAIVAGLLFLLPEWMVFYGAAPTLLVLALLSTLYCANLLSRSIRAQETDSKTLFVILMGLLLLLIKDGWAAAPIPGMPPLSSIGAVGVLLLVTTLMARQTLAEHKALSADNQQLQRDMQERVIMSVLDSATAATAAPSRFLDAVVHELAYDLEVRRVSLVLPRRDGSLCVASSIGLPRHAQHLTVKGKESVALWVYKNATALTRDSLRGVFDEYRSSGHYYTNAFISCPLVFEGRCVGVVNVTDSNHGRDFSAQDQVLLTERSNQMAELVTRLNIDADAYLDSLPARTKVDPTPNETPELDQTEDIDAEEDANAVTPAPANVAEESNPQLSSENGMSSIPPEENSRDVLLEHDEPAAESEHDEPSTGMASEQDAPAEDGGRTTGSDAERAPAPAEPKVAASENGDSELNAPLAAQAAVEED